MGEQATSGCANHGAGGNGGRARAIVAAPGEDFAFAAGNGLKVEAASAGDSAVFEAFFAGYDAAFVLADEKEDRAGFQACLALNGGPDHTRLTQRYGPFREIILIAHDSKAPELGPVGGANFLALPLRAGERLVITINLNYLYVSAHMRGRGYLRKLLAVVVEAARRSFIVDGGRPSLAARLGQLGQSLLGRKPDDVAAALARAQIVIFLEQNDPFRLSDIEYALDSAHAGVDQVTRMAMWARLGAKILDYEYIQPALSADQAPDPKLLYSVIGWPMKSLPAALLADHLERFFAISVLKGQGLETTPVAWDQIRTLRAAAAGSRRSVALLDPRPGLAALEGLAKRPEADSFRGFLATLPKSDAS